MIEIKAYDEARPVTPDGPHDPESTQAVAQAVTEALRLLNYATMPGKRGLTYASDVYGVIGSLAEGLHTFPQALRQMRDWLTAQIDEGAVQENEKYGPYGGHTAAARAAFIQMMDEASERAKGLAFVLSEAQTAIRGLEAAHEGKTP